MSGLTVHSMIRNEPFIYYSIKSVYKYADKILLTDTGSDDSITLDGIKRLLEEDVEKKIRFEVTPTPDMTRWITNKLAFICKALTGIRQKHIDDTETEFFLLVDGDEVHYQEGIRQVVEEVISNWPEGKICCGLPNLSFLSLSEIVPIKKNSCGVRLFRTEDVYVKGAFPYEMHCSKKGGILRRSDPTYFYSQQVPRYAHFLYLKSWRRVIIERHSFRGSLPEVMLEDDSFIKRYQESQLKKE